MTRSVTFTLGVLFAPVISVAQGQLSPAPQPGEIKSIHYDLEPILLVAVLGHWHPRLDLRGNVTSSARVKGPYFTKTRV